MFSFTFFFSTNISNLICSFCCCLQLLLPVHDIFFYGNICVCVYISYYDDLLHWFLGCVWMACVSILKKFCSQCHLCSGVELQFCAWFYLFIFFHLFIVWRVYCGVLCMMCVFVLLIYIAFAIVASNVITNSIVNLIYFLS